MTNVKTSDKFINVGKGKKMSDTWFKITINPDKLQDHILEYEGHKYVKLNINTHEPNKYGNDVSISIDTYNPSDNK